MNALNPFLNGLKNGLKNAACEQSLRLVCCFCHSNSVIASFSSTVFKHKSQARIFQTIHFGKFQSNRCIYSRPFLSKELSSVKPQRSKDTAPGGYRLIGRGIGGDGREVYWTPSGSGTHDFLLCPLSAAHGTSPSLSGGPTVSSVFFSGLSLLVDLTARNDYQGFHPPERVSLQFFPLQLKCFLKILVIGKDKIKRNGYCQIPNSSAGWTIWWRAITWPGVDTIEQIVSNGNHLKKNKLLFNQVDPRSKHITIKIYRQFFFPLQRKSATDGLTLFNLVSPPSGQITTALNHFSTTHSFVNSRTPVRLKG